VQEGIVALEKSGDVDRFLLDDDSVGIFKPERRPTGARAVLTQTSYGTRV
jgi:hypothetical protein